MTYYRIQHAGEALSQSHRSEVQDGSGFEDGTSCCRSLEDLLIHQGGGFFDAPRGRVEIIEFTGDCVSIGSDGEPTVVPEHEVARWHHPDWDGLPRGVDAEDVESLDELGFHAMEPMDVEE